MIFSPHPRTKGTTADVVRIMRDVMVREGAPADVFQCVEQPSIPLSQRLMAECDLTLATGGAAMVEAAYSSGKPAFGVGGGNSTMVIDETADVVEAACNMWSVEDVGLRLGLLGRRQSADRRPDLRRDARSTPRRRWISRVGRRESAARTSDVGQRRCSDPGNRRPTSGQTRAAAAGIAVPDDRTFVIA